MNSLKKLTLLAVCTTLICGSSFADKKQPKLKDEVLKSTYADVSIAAKSIWSIAGILTGAGITTGGLFLKEKLDDKTSAKVGGIMLAIGGGVVFGISLLDLTVFKTLDLLKQAKAFWYMPVESKKKTI